MGRKLRRVKLAALQQAVCAHLIDAAAPQLRELVGDHPGLAVYRHNYRGQLLDCLRDTYEQCWSWLGDDAFADAASRYVAGHPPTGWSLDAYGEGLPEMLAALLPEDPEVAELAWLEWSLRRAFDGADAAPVDLAGLGDVDWDHARLRFAPTLRCGDMTTNAAAIWTALTSEQAPPPAALLPAPATILIWRDDLTPSFRTLDPVEAQALGQARQGAAFGDICAGLAGVLGEERAAAAAGAWLGQWLQAGLIVGID
jgi:hypothetical protein